MENPELAMMAQLKEKQNMLQEIQVFHLKGLIANTEQELLIVNKFLEKMKSLVTKVEKHNGGSK